MKAGRLVLFLLLLAIAPACASGPSESSRVGGEVVMIGGPWPDRHIRPKTSFVVVTTPARAVVKQVRVAAGSFGFTLPRGDYRVSAHLEQAELTCGPPRRVTIPARRDVVLHFSCPIK